MQQNTPDWKSYTLDDGILAEPSSEAGRLVLWVPTERDQKFQYWERVANVARGTVTVDQGICSTPATSVRARQRSGSVVGQFWRRLVPSNGDREFLLPNNASAEQCGERQTELFFVWPEDKMSSIEEGQLQARWPDARRFQRLGENFFLVSAGGSPGNRGEIGPKPMQPPEIDCPTKQAEALLTDARHAGDRKKEASALTDLGAIALSEGHTQQSIGFLEKALAIARELSDANQESDIVGNLGMALLTVRQAPRARTLFQHALAHSRATNDRFAEKLALERLGLASWHIADYRGALELFDQALSLTRQLGDRHQEANLLWQQGIQYAELGQRESAIAKAEEAIALFKILGKPQANSYGAYLQKYRMGLFDDSPSVAGVTETADRSPYSYLGGSIVASVMAGHDSAESASAKGTGGPGLLRMALSATRAMAGFVGSGFKTTPAEIQRKRLETCATCEHHTGLRCKICGCFTNVKSRMLHEDCPIGKWPA
jgi:tetratricopeptide (TPR) repeat protein